jgi:ATP-dependent DNA ligase
MYHFPVLYGTDKSGKPKQWSASVYEKDNIVIAEIEFGQVGGKLQKTTREYTEGKNIGKKNETTPYQQCLNETRKRWEDKKEKESYTEGFPEDLPKDSNKDLPKNSNNPSNNPSDNPSEDEKSEKYFPMLAHTYEPSSTKKKKNDIVFPCYVQPKLDGLRCIVYMSSSSSGGGLIICQSRTGTYFETMEHIVKEITPYFKGDKSLVFDGELYTTEMPFEQLAGLIKKKKITDVDRERLKHVKYHIYDIINDDPYSKRYKWIHENIHDKRYLSSVPAFLTDKKGFKKYFSEFVEDGYEGIMLRNIEGLYRCNYRSHDLQKYKEFMESEYEIVGAKEGDGRDKGTVIWVCKNEEGKEFSVRPRGTIEMRKEWFENGHEYIGSMLTVIYQELSELGIPRFPVGKSIRDGF